MIQKSKTASSLLRLDLLEVKFLKYQPRYHKTTKLLEAKHNQKLLKKLSISKEEADEEIETIKTQIFELKYHGSRRKITKESKKVIKADLHKLSKDPKHAKLVLFLQDETIFETLITVKLVKLIQQTILTTKQLKLNPPAYIPKELVDIIINKSHASNPSKFFIDHCQNDKEINSYVSNMWNSKGMKKVCDEAEWSFRLARGNISKQEKENRRKALGKKVYDEEEDEEDEEGGSEGEQEGDDLESEGEGEGEADDDDRFVLYDNLEQEQDEIDQVPELDPNVNYNEITDEEPSEEEDIQSSDSQDIDETSELRGKKRKNSELEGDDFFAELEEEDEEEEDSDDDEESMEKKYNLPQLAAGYYSGGSDDEDGYEVDEDKVVKEATSQRKNRRGQRARQKIWEKKYGTKAKHKQKEIAAVNDDRERRRLEYEERCRKREEKAKRAQENAPSGSNTEPLGQRKSAKKESSATPDFEHPSWKAKKIEEERLKNVKFSGKKITFD